MFLLQYVVHLKTKTKVDGAKIPTSAGEGLKHRLCHEASKIWQMGRVGSKNHYGLRGFTEVHPYLALVRRVGACLSKPLAG